jgi:mRNA interferase RelE/StbE
VRYRIEVTKAGARDLRTLAANILKRVDARILSLAKQPRPDGVKKLIGAEDLCRVRVGDYRIIYEIHDAVILVSIIRVRHRREVYR